MQRQYFDAWGQRLVGNASPTKRTFTGQYLDDTGLVFYNARYCDPGIGRFASADSIVLHVEGLTPSTPPAWGRSCAPPQPPPGKGGVWLGSVGRACQCTTGADPVQAAGQHPSFHTPPG